MSVFAYSDSVTTKPVSLYYQVAGEGCPLLLIAPGGMKSSVPLWRNAPYSPFERWKDGFRLVAMDQRNAGQSTGPVDAAHGWETFAEDQLALLDHLGIDRFIVAGMCIGGSYVMQLAVRAPDRVLGAVLMQTIGLDANREAFYQMYDAWANELASTRTDVTERDWRGLRERMYGSDKYLFSVGEAEVPSIRTPTLVLMGNDLYHPASASRRVAEQVSGAMLVERWKTGEDIEAGLGVTLDFLHRVAERS